MARSRNTSSSCRQEAGRNAAVNFSPFWSTPPSIMLSSTVILESALVSWNVRTMPWPDIRWATEPPMSTPLNSQVPSSGVSKPVSRLNSVVLPAPLGPIRPVITPRWISRWSTSTAVRPPKRRRTLSTTRIESGLATPGRPSTSASTPCEAIGRWDRVTARAAAILRLGPTR